MRWGILHITTPVFLTLDPDTGAKTYIEVDRQLLGVRSIFIGKLP